MKKLLNIIFGILLFTSLISCSDNKNVVPEIDIYATTVETTTETLQPQKSEIIVFADSSLQEILDTIKKDYESKYANTNIIYKFDTSESLKNDIINIADCDVFISTDSNILDKIDVTKGTDVNAEMFDFIEPNSRVLILLKDDKTTDSSWTCEACIIRFGLNIKEARRFIDYISSI